MASTRAEPAPSMPSAEDRSVSRRTPSSSAASLVVAIVSSARRGQEAPVSAASTGSTESANGAPRNASRMAAAWRARQRPSSAMATWSMRCPNRPLLRTGTVSQRRPAAVFSCTRAKKLRLVFEVNCTSS